MSTLVVAYYARFHEIDPNYPLFSFYLNLKCNFCNFLHKHLNALQLDIHYAYTQQTLVYPKQHVLFFDHFDHFRDKCLN